MSLSFHGCWSEDQSQLHINMLEIKAIRFVLKKALKYIWEIFHWCLEQHIVVRVRQIPGKFNVLADRLSRMDKPLKTEWALDQSIANSIFQMLTYPNVDLLATRFNHKLPLYVSPVLDNQALAIHAFSGIFFMLMHFLQQY